MLGNKKIQGFSKLSREEKIRIASEFAAHPAEFAREMFSVNQASYKSDDAVFDFTENAVSEFRLPYSVAPNFRIDGEIFMVPMVTEESSVVAAASSAAKFWFDLGGFRTGISGLTKPGHIHFLWSGDPGILQRFFNDIQGGFRNAVSSMLLSMESRGGGIQSIRLADHTDKIANYYQVEVLFNTVDAMGANFINTCLETMADFMISQAQTKGISRHMEIIMSILSNYTPECIVKCEVLCSINDLTPEDNSFTSQELARRFAIAVDIARKDVNRAVTHNKGIFNGIDAVILATGNDFRAVEAAGHAWASRNGCYASLSDIDISNGEFYFHLSLPLAVGVTGGITSLHPAAKASLQLLGNPDARRLMSVIVSAGMANHFSAIRALVTHGIQKGHMKLHLVNILNQLKADETEKESAILYFSKEKVTYNSVREYLSQLRSEYP